MHHKIKLSKDLNTVNIESTEPVAYEVSLDQLYQDLKGLDLRMENVTAAYKKEIDGLENDKIRIQGIIDKAVSLGAVCKDEHNSET